MNAIPLSPTLWRTCRMLAGATRIRLLRQLQDHPGQHVSALAEAVGIGVSDASQELRRIQSRGILQAERQGARLVYRFGADPLVYSATPLLKALRASLATPAPEGDRQIQAVARGLGHAKRIAMLQSLLQGPLNAHALHQAVGTSYSSIGLHVQALLDGGFIRRERSVYHAVPPTHPLARALVRLLSA